ncbi:MAG: Ig-like domain-containing protein [Mariniphaga sp.]|nr:Ig-like domain-containing protein [Mariniphaga sp.]
MKKILFYILAIISTGFSFTGCDPFEEYESSDVLAQPITTLAISAVEDSSFVVDVSTNMAGYMGYVVASDTTMTTPEAITIIAGSLKGASGVHEIKTYQMESAGGQSATTAKLMPNTYYKVFAASSNVDGVESTVQSYLVKTDDGVGPTFISSSPAISNQATVAVGSDIVLTFDEPVKVAANKKFIFTYYYEGVTVETTLDESHASGKNITVPQPHEGHAGDYFFLSWEAGAVTDLSGNLCDERESGVIDGSLNGNFYRFEKISFEFDLTSVVPENGSVILLTDTYMDISYTFPVKLVTALTQNMVKFKYTSFDGKVVKEVSATEYAEVLNNTTLRVTLPQVPEPGDVISLYLAEGVLQDNYGNLNAASDYELSWTLPRFNMEMLVGEYTVSGESAFEGNPPVSDVVTIEINPEDPTTFLITGIFESLLGASLPMEATFDAANSIINIPEQIIGQDEENIYTASSDLTSDYSINVSIGDDGTMTSDLALNVYDLEFNWLGYGEYVEEATWIKNETKSAAMKSITSGLVTKKITIKKSTRGMN